MSRLDFDKENWEGVVELHLGEPLYKPLMNPTEYAMEMIEGATAARYKGEEDEPSRTDTR